MRVTILTLGSRGDVQPFLAFGLGLAQAGHEVRIATHPKFEPLSRAVGLAFAPLAEGRVSRGPDTEEGRRWMDSGSRRLPTWVGFLKDARSVARQRLADAVAACEAADAIIASNLATLLGWQMSDRLGIPLVRALLNPPSRLAHGRARPASAAARQAIWLSARPWLRSVQRGAGLPPRLPFREPIGIMCRDRVPVLYPFSPSVVSRPADSGDRVDVTGYWFLDQSLDPDPPPGLADFLAAGPPPVCIGFGSLLDPDPAASTRIVIEALSRANMRGVIVRGQFGFGGSDFPEGVYAVDTVSHDWLFPRCACVVHHAAGGTTAAAVRAGVPSVPVPHMSDQFWWARRIHELGVGAAPIPRRRLSAPRLAAAILAASGDHSMRGRAASLGRRIRTEDGVARGVEAFERHVVGAAPPAVAARVS